MTVINGILLGSSVSIALSLLAVMLSFVILGDAYPRVTHEFSALLESALIFLALTAISALSFYSILKERRSRWWWQGALWAGLAATAVHFWP